MSAREFLQLSHKSKGRKEVVWRKHRAKKTGSRGEDGERYGDSEEGGVGPETRLHVLHASGNIVISYLLKSNSMRLTNPQILKGTTCNLLSFNKSVSSVGESSAEGSSQSVFMS